jgi:subtilisin family serine protease
MSLGDSYQSWPSYPTATAALTMQKAGVILVASAGNDGTDGSFTVGAPSVSDGAISVASFDNTNIPAHKFTTSTGATVPYLPSTDSPSPVTSQTLQLAVAGTDTPPVPDTVPPTPITNTACRQISPDVSGKAALIKRGGCTFYLKALHAQQAGAKAVVIYNNAPGLVNAGLTGTEKITIPVVVIPLTDGTTLAAALATPPVSMTWADGWITTPNPTGGLVSSFSSYGLAADLTLKPDLGAPGGNILSTWPLEKGKYANESGTSMSSPHVTGAVALLLQAKPELKGKTTKVRELLQTTATLADWSGYPGAGYLEPVHRQGGGLIQIATAITTKQTVSPGKISLGEGSDGPKTTKLTLTNSSSAPVTYTIAKSDGIATLGSAITDNFFQEASATMSAPATVTVPAKGSATVKVKLTAPTDPALNTAIYGGWVTFTAPGATTLHVPFAGMVGDYQSVKVLTGDGLPTLAQYQGGDCAPVPGSTVFTMVGNDLPCVMLHLDYPVSNLRIDIFKVGRRGVPLPVAPNYRSWVKTGPTGKDPSYQAYYFDGTYTTLGSHGKQYPLSNGTYVFVVTVTKALASGHSRSDYETWTSPTFTITKPV